MRQLREFELWLEVEKPLSAKRKLSGKGGAGPCGEIPHLEKTGNSRDLAAQRVGLNDGSTAEKALKGLKAADQPCCS